MFWRLWWRGVSVKRSQAALALGSLVVGAAITSMLLNLYGDVRRKMTEDFRAYGANVVIAPASMKIGSSAEGSATMEQSALEPLAPLPGRFQARHLWLCFTAWFVFHPNIRIPGCRNSPTWWWQELSWAHSFV